MPSRIVWVRAASAASHEQRGRQQGEFGIEMLLDRPDRLEAERLSIHGLVQRGAVAFDRGFVRRVGGSW